MTKKGLTNRLKLVRKSLGGLTFEPDAAEYPKTMGFIVTALRDVDAALSSLAGETAAPVLPAVVPASPAESSGQPSGKGGSK